MKSDYKKALKNASLFGCTAVGAMSAQAAQPSFQVTATTNMLYVATNGSDALAARGQPFPPFATLHAAKLAARSGDTINVYPGLYNDNDLITNGVNWNFGIGGARSVTIVDAPATTIPNSNWPIFGDQRCGKTTNIISGFPNLIYHTGTNGQDIGGGSDTGSITIGGGDTNCFAPVFLTNGSTAFYQLGTIGFGSLTNLILQNVTPSALCIANVQYADITHCGITNLFGCTGRQSVVSVTNNSYGSPVTAQDYSTGIYWGQGETHIHGPVIGNFPQYGIWCAEPPGVSNLQNFYYTGDVIHQKIYQTANNRSYKCWYTITEIDCTNASALVCFDIFGGSAYLEGNQKTWDEGTALGSSCFNFQGGSYVEVHSLKAEALGGAAGGGEGFITGGVGGGQMFADVMNYTDGDGKLLRGITINQAGLDLYMDGGNMWITNGTGLVISAGTNHVKGLYVNTSTGAGTTNYPAVITGGTLMLSGCTLVSPAGTDSIHAGTAQTVGVLSSSSANIMPNANITLSPNAGFNVDSGVK